MYDNGRFLLPLGIVMDKKIQEINYYTNNIKLITMVNFSLEGKVALVTGASYGIGFAIASAFAAAGATIVFNDIKQELVDKGLAAYQEKGIKAFGYVCDVTSEEQVNALVAQVEKEVGVIDILVNNAGIIKRIPMCDMSAAEFRQVIDVDLNAPFIVSKAVIPGMIKKGHGKIINICSMMSELGRETVSAYAAAKGGLKMLTRNIASEYGEYNIQCNGIGPGYIATPQTAPLRELQADGSRHPFDQFIIAKTPAARWGTPEDLQGPAVFLASDASDFVNGHVLYVDGGILAVDGYADTMKQFGENIDWTNVDTAITEINKFSADKWEALRNAFPAFSDTIANSHSSLEHMNTFLGINMSQEPGFGFTLAILIPILAGVTQFISVKVAQSGQNTEVDDDNPMAASMKMTMYIMPLMSAFIAISVPAGLGLYWIATAVVQTIITVFINRYYDKLGADEIVKRNVEKRNKKRAKKGLPPEKIAKNATTSTKNMSASREKAVKSLEQIKAENEKKVQEIKESSKYYKTAKPGSLAEKAGMVAKYNEKNTKNGGKKN